MIYQSQITEEREQTGIRAAGEKTNYEMTENVKIYKDLECPNHKDKTCILSRLKKMKISPGCINSLKSETDDGLSSCSNFPERATKEELEMAKTDITRN